MYIYFAIKFRPYLWKLRGLSEEYEILHILSLYDEAVLKANNFIKHAHKGKFKFKQYYKNWHTNIVTIWFMVQVCGQT